MNKISLFLLVACIALPCAASEKTIDTLLYTIPQTYTGYTNTPIFRIGKSLPAWEMQTSEEKKQTETPLPFVVGIGISNNGYNIILSQYPRTTVTTAWGFGFLHESTKTTMTARAGLGDSILALLHTNSVVLPNAVSQSSVLDYIRCSYEVRVNGMPMFDAHESLPFAINPYVGIGLFADAGFGSMRQRYLDTLVPIAHSKTDSLFKMFDSTYSRINVDIGLGIPLGVEIFPFSKFSIPALRHIGVSFTYTLLAKWRVFAYPDTAVNPYMSLYNSNKNSNDSGSSSKNSSGNSIGWFGFKNIKTDNEFRCALHYWF